MAMQQQSESQQPSAVSEVSETLDASLTEVVPSGSINLTKAQIETKRELTKAQIETKREINEQLAANQVKVQEQLEANQAELNNKLVESFQKLDDKLNKTVEELKIQNEKTELKLAAKIEQVTQQCNENAKKLRLELTEYVATKLDTITEQVESIPQIIQAQEQMQCSIAVILVLVEVQDELKQQVNEMSADMQDLRQSQDKIPKDIQNLEKSINNIKERQDEVDHKILAGKFSQLSLERKSISPDNIEHTLLVLDVTGRRDPRREAASPDAASTAAEWAPDKALRCQTPWGCPRKAAAGQAAQPPLGKAARLRGRRPSAPKVVATEEVPQASERPPGALPDEAAWEASTGRAVDVVAATAAAAALGAAAKSEGAAGTRRGPNLWTKN
ncbi:FK506-binding protein 15-like [Schistocerca americana]|uniref:FK506-binding protein 15-like n=1 Tax=Schistocerca americana TaxID=7009 RepID=UPI001F4F7958|nr:FK506-binding protein 15-like [Schistocerca americana]